MFYLFKQRPKIIFRVRKSKTRNRFGLAIIDDQGKHLAVCGSYATQANAKKSAHAIALRLTQGTKPPIVSIIFEQT